MPKVRVDFLGDSGSLERALRRSSSAAKVFGSDFERAATRSEKAAKGLKGLSPGAGLAAGVAGAAILAGIKSTISAAANAQQVLGQTKVALEDTGLSWAKYGKQVEKAIDAQRKLGFDDEELLKTFSLFVRRTGDVGKALDRNQLSLDVARARYIDLATAANIVNKASLGQAGALRRLGIEAPKGANGLQLITLLTEKYGGAAKAASKDATTANQRFQVSIQNVQEQIGSGLLPAVTTLADNFSIAADNASKLVEELQKIGGDKPTGGKGFFGNLFESNSLQQLTDFVKLTKSGTPVKFGETPKQTFDRLKALKDGSKLFAKEFGGGAEGSRKAGIAFGKAFGLAALEAAGKAAGKGAKPPPIFGEPGKFKIPAAAQIRPGPSVEQRNTIFDNSVSRALNRAGNLDTSKQLSALQKVAATLTQRIAVTKDVTRKLNLEDQLISVVAQQKGLREQLAQDFTDALQFNVDKAGATKSLVDDLAALKRLEDNLKKRLAADKTNLDLQQQVFAVEQQQKDLAQQQRQNRVDRITSEQFRELGLGADGSEITPGVANLKKRLGNFEEAVKGTFLDTSKTRNQLARFRKVLSEALVPKDVRSKFAEMLDDLNRQLTEHAGATRAKFHKANLSGILAASGLDPDEVRRVRQQLGQVSGSGFVPNRQRAFSSQVRPVVVQANLYVDGQKMAAVTKKHDRKAATRRTSPRRGPYAGRD